MKSFASLQPSRRAASRSLLRMRESDAFLHSLSEATQGRVWLAASMTYGPTMRQDLAERVALARATQLPLIATNDVLMHEAARRPLQDVLTSIRNGIPLDAIGRQPGGQCRAPFEERR